MAAQSVLDARRSASATSRSFVAFASPWAASSPAKWRATRLVEAVAGRAEPGPQGGLGLAVESGGGALVRLPLVEQLPHTGAARLPLDLAFWLSGDGLGLGDDRLALGRGRGAGLCPVLLLDRALARDARLDLVELGGEGVEVTDDGCVLDLRGQRLEAVGDVLRRHLRERETLLEEDGRGEELVVLAGEVGQRLGIGRTGVGAHLTLALGGAHEDGAVLVDPPEGGRGRVVRLGRRRGHGRHGVRRRPGEGGRGGDGTRLGHGHGCRGGDRWCRGRSGHLRVRSAPPRPKATRRRTPGGLLGSCLSGGLFGRCLSGGLGGRLLGGRLHGGRLLSGRLLDRWDLRGLHGLQHVCHLRGGRVGRSLLSHRLLERQPPRQRPPRPEPPHPEPPQPQTP